MNVPVKCHICVMATQLCCWMIQSTSGGAVTTQRGPAMCFMPLMSVSKPVYNSQSKCYFEIHLLDGYSHDGKRENSFDIWEL